MADDHSSKKVTQLAMLVLKHLNYTAVEAMSRPMTSLRTQATQQEAMSSP